MRVFTFGGDLRWWTVVYYSWLMSGGVGVEADDPRGVGVVNSGEQQGWQVGNWRGQDLYLGIVEVWIENRKEKSDFYLFIYLYFKFKQTQEV